MGAMLYQLSYKASLEAGQVQAQFIYNKYIVWQTPIWGMFQCSLLYVSVLFNIVYATHVHAVNVVDCVIL